MTDPFVQFLGSLPRAEVAGYFERSGASPDRPHEAAWFDRAEQHLVLDRASSVGELQRRSETFFRRCPRGGVFGYIGFDAVGLFEPVLRHVPPGGPFPLGELVFAPDTRRRRFRPPAQRALLEGPPQPVPTGDSLPKRRYEASVRRLVHAIREGEAFQVVLAHRREWERPQDLWTRAAELRATERFAFFYALKFGDQEIVGAAPESVVEVAGRSATVNPIAGTLPHHERGRRRSLAVDPKELSEHRMLVDLARNDLGRVARPGSVRLAYRERRERYARLEHLVSRVTADLREGVGPFDVLAATFPAGTVSGAPKIRATDLLRREEGSWRGPYGGTVACLSAHRADFALTIRSAFTDHDRLYTAAGAGIVHGSQPSQEFDETLAKLAHLESTLVGGRE